jgi:dihydroneopterin aldolase
MVFDGHVGVTEEERGSAQPIEIDVELELDLQPAGQSDDLSATVDYGRVFEACAATMASRSFKLLEGVAESVAAELLARFDRVGLVRVSVAKPGVPIDGVIDHAGVRIERRRYRRRSFPRGPPGAYRGSARCATQLHLEAGRC